WRPGWLAIWAGIGITVLAPAGSIRADVLTFFGQDYNIDPFGQADEDTPLLNHPMADAAQAAFLANIRGVPGIETFETLPRLTTAASGDLKAQFSFPGGGTDTATFVAPPEGGPYNVFVFGPP